MHIYKSRVVNKINNKIIIKISFFDAIFKILFKNANHDFSCEFIFFNSVGRKFLKEK